MLARIENLGYQIKKVLTLIESSQNPDGGWGPTRDTSSNAGATVYAVHALYFTSKTYSINLEQVGKGVDWLLRAQNPGGSWPPIPGRKGSVWCTAEAIRALLFERDKWLTQITPAVSWLVNVQNPNGGWGITEGEMSDTHDTCHALLGLFAVERKLTSDIEKGLKWLCNCQNPDGGWGSHLGEESGVDLAIHALEVLLNIKVRPEIEAVSKAIEHIKQNQARDGGWRINDERYNATFFAPLTLLKAGALTESQLIQKGVQWILQSQNEDGGWSSMPKGPSDMIYTSIGVQSLIALERRDFVTFYM